MVQVVVSSIPLDVDAVSAPRNVLVVQRLVQVADEVDDELGRLGAPPRRQRGIERLLGVVGQRGDDAARLLAVALKVDVARLGRVVVRVDEVERAREPAPFRVSDRIGPAGYLGHVVGLIAAQELLQVGLGRVGDEVAGNVGGRDVAET